MIYCPQNTKKRENEPDSAAWFCKICTMDMFPFGHLADKHMPQSIDSRYLTIPELSSLQVSSTEVTIRYHLSWVTSISIFEIMLPIHQHVTLPIIFII